MPSKILLLTTFFGLLLSACADYGGYGSYNYPSYPSYPSYPDSYGSHGYSGSSSYPSYYYHYDAPYPRYYGVPYYYTPDPRVEKHDPKQEELHELQ